MSIKRTKKNSKNKTSENLTTVQTTNDVETKITFHDIQMYLDAIADNANLSVDNNPSCPHERFWSVKYVDFVNGVISNVKSNPPIPIPCMGQPIPIINQADPINSSFFLILKGGFCNKRQMPAGGGPFITDKPPAAPMFQVILSDGTNINGQQIIDNIAKWLTTGFHEN